jgi:putative hydrolase of the HAD superfamily
MTNESEREPSVKAVLLDLGGTLVSMTEIPKIYRRILGAHGIMRSMEEISHAQKEVEKQLDIQELAVLFEEYWIRWNLLILRRLGIKENAEALARTIADRWWDYADVMLYPDVEETLQKLRVMGLKIGIVTNGLKSDYRQILEKVGLLDFFDVKVGIDKVGKMKPDRDIFLYALNELEISPSETLFVGDEMIADYEGAKKAGLIPLLIDRDNVIGSNVEKIRSLREILNYLR